MLKVVERFSIGWVIIYKRDLRLNEIKEIWEC